MVETRERRHGLESFLASRQANDDGSTGVKIQIQADLGQINLRGDPDNVGFITAANSALGQELPVMPNTLNSGEHRICWLGPNEWLVVTNVLRNPDLVVRLRKLLAGQHASVTDVTGGQVVVVDMD